MALIFAIDIGGTAIKTGLCDHQGSIVYKSSLETKAKERDGDDLLQAMYENFRAVLDDCELDVSEIDAIGAGSAGIVDSRRGIIVHSANLPFRNTDIRAFFAAKTGLPLYIANDAACAALAESKIGAAKGYKNSLTITLGTGIGCGVIIDGKIFSGAFGAAGELAHTVIQVNGEACACGRKGCFERYCSAGALTRQGRKKAEKNPDSLLAKLGARDGEFTAKTVFEAYKAGDEAAKEVLQNYLNYMGEGMANIINILNPEIICFAGGLSRQGDYFIKMIEEVSLPNCLSYGKVTMPKFVTAELSFDAGLSGAALVAVEALKKVSI